MVKDIDYTHKLSDYHRWFMWQIFQRIDEEVELYNFIVSHYNSIKPKEIRSAKIAEWKNLLQYWINLSERLNAFEKSIIFNYYFGELEMHEYTTIKNPTVEYDALYHKCLGIIKSIEGIEDIVPLKYKNEIVFVREGYNENEIPYVPYEELRRKEKSDNYNKFSNLSDDLKQSIVDFYFMYQEACAKAEEDYYHNDFWEIINDGRTQDDFMEYYEFVWSKAKHEAVLDRLLQQYFYNFRDSSILKKYEKFFKENDLAEHVVSNSDEIEKFIEVDTNLILTSYFLHYVLRSMGVKTNADSTEPKPDELVVKQLERIRQAKKDSSDAVKTQIPRIDRSYINSVQRLLCAITTKQIEKLEDYGNSYYRTFNQIFKFNSEFEVEKEKVLKYLYTTQELLSKYGFKDAIKYIKRDINAIERVETKHRMSR